MSSNVKVDKISPTTNCGTVTLGDSGDTISIPSGATLNVGGSVSGIEGIVSWDTTPKTSAFTAVAGNGYFVDTSSAAITVTLPASPSAGDLVGVKDYKLTSQTNNITLARNGSNIQGSANNFLIDTEGRSVTLIYVDSTQGWLVTGSSQATDIFLPFITATGGTVTTCGDFKIHTFTSPGTFCVSCAGSGTPTAPSVVDYTVIAGGGGGAFNGGGGGAGGYRSAKTGNNGSYTASPLATPTGITVTATAFPITVGGGGAGGSNPSRDGTTGSNSVFSTITSAGGGGGGRSNNACAAKDGGSGGGAGEAACTPATTGGSGNTPPVSPPQGNNGGSVTSPASAAGGGGATTAGSSGSPGGPGVGGTGGSGATSEINGTSTTRAGGGGGGSFYTGGPGGAGGPGGGGRGSPWPGSTPSNVGEDGTTNTGSGGGGGSTGSGGGGGAGGSGVVIIRYRFQ
jgi:hypothetical protein